MDLPTSHLSPWSSAAGTSNCLRSKMPVLCGMTGLVSSLGGFEIRQRERKSQACPSITLGIRYLPNKCWFHGLQFPDVHYVTAFNRQRAVAGMMWKFWVFRLRCPWCFSTCSQHLVCSKPSALASAVLDHPQRLQGDSSVCAACSTTHAEEGGPLLCFKKWVVTSPLLMCPCYVPAHMAQPHTSKSVSLHHRVCLWLFWCLLWPNTVGLPFAVHCPFTGNSESNARLVMIAFLSNLTLIISK